MDETKFNDPILQKCFNEHKAEGLEKIRKLNLIKEDVIRLQKVLSDFLADKCQIEIQDDRVSDNRQFLLIWDGDKIRLSLIPKVVKEDFTTGPSVVRNEPILCCKAEYRLIAADYLAELLRLALQPKERKYDRVIPANF